MKYQAGMARERQLYSASWLNSPSPCAPVWTGRSSKNRCRQEGRCFPGMTVRLISGSCWSGRSSRTWSMCLNGTGVLGSGNTGHQCQDSESPGGGTQSRMCSAYVSSCAEVSNNVRYFSRLRIQHRMVPRCDDSPLIKQSEAVYPRK